jgi:probable rRNA maturation factor
MPADDASEVRVAGRCPLPPEQAVAAVRAVLHGERCGAVVSVTFVGRDRMRALHRTYRQRPGVTDVLAFALPTPDGRLAGDVYVCPWVARRNARRHGVSVREELLRLIIHGTLHVLGHDHPSTGDRTRSRMWRLQERYLRRLS